MPNNRYARGATWERKVVKDLTEKGFVAMRSAGSHTHFDVIALCDGRKPVAVQCKTASKKGRARISPAERGEFLEACKQAGAMPMLAMKDYTGEHYLAYLEEKDSWVPLVEQPRMTVRVIGKTEGDDEDARD